MHSAPLVTSLPGLARPATPPRAAQRPGLDPGPPLGSWTSTVLAWAVPRPAGPPCPQAWVRARELRESGLRKMLVRGASQPVSSVSTYCVACTAPSPGASSTKTEDSIFVVTRDLFLPSQCKPPAQANPVRAPGSAAASQLPGSVGFLHRWPQSPTLLCSWHWSATSTKQTFVGCWLEVEMYWYKQ